MIKQQLESEIQRFFAVTTFRFGWGFILYSISLLTLSQLRFDYPIVLIIGIPIVLMTSTALDLMHFVFPNLVTESQKMRWLHWNKVFRAILFASVSFMMSAHFLTSGVMNWASLLTVAAWGGTIESIVATSHPARRFTKFMLIGFSTPMTISFFFIPDSQRFFAVFLVFVTHFLLFKKTDVRFAGFVDNCKSKINSEMAQAQTEQLINSVPGAIMWLDSDLKYLKINHQATEILGVGIKDVIGRKMGFTNKTDPQLREFFRHFLSSNEVSKKIMIPFVVGQQSRRFELTLSKMKTEDPLKTNLIIFSQDVEEQLSVEDALQDEKVKHQNNSKLATLGEMASGIAHEIKNPLAIISGANSIIKNESVKELEKMRPEKILEKTQVIEKTIKRIVLIIEGMRKLSRSDTHSDDEWTSASTLIQETMSFCEESIRFLNIELTVKLPPENIQIFTKGAQLSQVLLNLISNAKDIVAKLPIKKMLVTGELLASGEFVFRVFDSGDGVADPDKLFTPFYTTKEPGQGTGLGLSISKKIMANHEGDLAYRRMSDMTVFEMQIPAVRVRAESHRKSA